MSSLGSFFFFLDTTVFYFFVDRYRDLIPLSLSAWGLHATDVQLQCCFSVEFLVCELDKAAGGDSKLEPTLVCGPGQNTNGVTVRRR